MDNAPITIAILKTSEPLILDITPVKNWRGENHPQAVRAKFLDEYGTEYTIESQDQALIQKWYAAAKRQAFP